VALVRVSFSVKSARSTAVAKRVKKGVLALRRNRNANTAQRATLVKLVKDDEEVWGAAMSGERR